MNEPRRPLGKAIAVVVSIAALGAVIYLWPKESKAWARALEQSSPEAFAEYMMQYPSGVHHSRAADRVAWAAAERDETLLQATSSMLTVSGAHPY